jgi:hypothetical protein
MRNATDDINKITDMPDDSLLFHLITPEGDEFMILGGGGSFRASRNGFRIKRNWLPLLLHPEKRDFAVSQLRREIFRVSSEDRKTRHVRYLA